MRRIASPAAILILMLAWALSANAQQTQLTLVGQPPAPVSSVGAMFTGVAGGQTPIYYWVVARYPAGYSIATGPAVANSTQGTQNLSATNYVTVTWPGVPSATGYDVIRSGTSAFPGPCSTCATALNTAALSVTDSGTVNSAWPPAGVPSAQTATVDWTVDNLTQSTPFVNVRLAGNSMKMALLKGTYSTSDCVKINSDGTIGSNGAACATVPVLTGYVLGAGSLTNVGKIPRVTAGGTVGESAVTDNGVDTLTIAARKIVSAGQNIDTCAAAPTMVAGSLCANGMVITPLTVGTLPVAAAGNKYTIQTVSDGLTSGDCTAGGGTATALCTSTGLAWTAMGGGGGGTLWKEQQILYTNAAFIVASTTATVTLKASTALVLMEGWVLQTKTAFAGAGVTSIVCTIGDGTTPDAYGPSGGEYQLLTAGSNTRLITDGGAFTTTMAAQTITLTCTSNVNFGNGAVTALTDGALNTWIKTETLTALP